MIINKPGSSLYKTYSVQPSKPSWYTPPLRGLAFAWREIVYAWMRFSADARSWATENATHQTLTLCSLIVTNNFFNKIITNTSHILQQFISDRITNYTFRTRSHNKNLIPKPSYLNDRNFLIRNLYKDCYIPSWPIFRRCAVFYICSFTVFL